MPFDLSDRFEALAFERYRSGRSRQTEFCSPRSSVSRIEEIGFHPKCDTILIRQNNAFFSTLAARRHGSGRDEYRGLHSTGGTSARTSILQFD